jgi:hypothetical protein
MFIGLGAVALESSRLHQKRQAKAEALATLNKDLEAAVHAKTRFFLPSLMIFAARLLWFPDMPI